MLLSVELKHLASASFQQFSALQVLLQPSPMLEFPFKLLGYPMNAACFHSRSLHSSSCKAYQNRPYSSSSAHAALHSYSKGYDGACRRSLPSKMLRLFKIRFHTYAANLVKGFHTLYAAQLFEVYFLAKRSIHFSPL